jgi:hypothetical protein
MDDMKSGRHGTADPSRLRPTPNLLVPGMQKSGTTFLCAHLARHPGILFSREKEPDLFREAGLNRRKYRRYLDTMFPAERLAAKSSLRYIAEGTTTYFQSPRALRAIRRYLGDDIRAIVCLRHPVDKAMSHYLHNWRRGRLSGRERISEIEGAAKSIYEWAFCAPHAESWIGAFGRQRLLFLRYELLVESPVRYLRAATDFLELEPLTRIDSERINAGFPVVEEGDAWVPDFGETRLLEGQVFPRFLRADLEFLLDRLRADVERLEELTGLDLAAWKAMPRAVLSR